MRTLEVGIEGGGKLQRFLAAMPDEAAGALRTAVTAALKAVHTEALIQISRHYTIGMPAVEKELRAVGISGGGSLVAQLKSRGRSRGALNFNVTPRQEKPSRPWSSKEGYNVEVTRGQKKHIGREYFWTILRGGNTHLVRREQSSDRKGRGKIKVFQSVSTPQMLGNPAVAEKVGEKARATLEEVFARAMDRRLLKNG